MMYYLILYSFVYTYSCDADSGVLADYVLVLINGTNKNNDELREICHEKLSDFLNERTEEFVVDLFTYLDSK